MGCGHTRRSLFAQPPSSIIDPLRGTTSATLERSRIKPYLIIPVLPLPYERIWDGHNTTTSCHGFPGNGYRASINPTCRKFHTADISLGLVPAPARIIRDHLPIRVEAPPKSTCLKAKGTRLVVPVGLCHNPLSLLHSRTTTSIITPPLTNTSSTTLKSPFQTLTGVQLCAWLRPTFGVALTDLVEYRQQSVSSLTNVPDDMFEGSGQVFTKFGFEYWAEPSAPENGFITWMVNGNPSHRVGADAMGPDQGPDGTGVGRRLIPEEPMVCLGSSLPTHAHSLCLPVVGS